MAKIKYTGPYNPMRIEGVGIVGPEFVPCPEEIAQAFKKEPGFEVEFDSTPHSALRTPHSKSGGDK